jgi:hypothetical protein
MPPQIDCEFRRIKSVLRRNQDELSQFQIFILFMGIEQHPLDSQALLR